AERQALELHTVLRHQSRLDAVARAEPEHVGPARGELGRDRESGKNMSASAASGDHNRDQWTPTLAADAAALPPGTSTRAGRSPGPKGASASMDGGRHAIAARGNGRDEAAALFASWGGPATLMFIRCNRATTDDSRNRCAARLRARCSWPRCRCR